MGWEGGSAVVRQTQGGNPGNLLPYSDLRGVTQALSVEQSLEYGANLSQSRGSRMPEASQPTRCCMEMS